MNKDIIGVFDSGFGGISVLNSCTNILPNYSYVFYGDSKNAPFGIKTKSELMIIAKNIIDKLIDYNPKAIVIACGTISTNIINELQDQYKNIKFIGTYPNFDVIFKKGLVLSENNIIFESGCSISIHKNRKKLLLIATDGTCKSDYINKLRDSYNSLLDIYIEPAGDIVDAVENNKTDTFEFNNYLKNLFKEYMDIDYLVLGCTHFPFVESHIRKLFNKNLQIISGCDTAALNLKEYLKSSTIDNDQKDTNTIKIIDSGISDNRMKTYMELIKNNHKFHIEFLK